MTRPTRHRKAALPRGTHLVLASASPRRAELLREAGYRFTVSPSPSPEPWRKPPEVPVEMWPAVLAYRKAQAVHQALGDPKAMVLGSDTIVVLQGRILNKPRDRRHAREMLRRLSGQEHAVMTGLALLCGEGHRFTTAVAICRIKPLTDAWLDAYLDSGLWRGKAGAYGIQDDHDPFVSLISGEWSTVVGLPMETLARELSALSGEI